MDDYPSTKDAKKLYFPKDKEFYTRSRTASVTLSRNQRIPRAKTAFRNDKMGGESIQTAYYLHPHDQDTSTVYTVKSPRTK